MRFYSLVWNLMQNCTISYYKICDLMFIKVLIALLKKVWDPIFINTFFIREIKSLTLNSKKISFTLKKVWMYYKNNESRFQIFFQIFHSIADKLKVFWLWAFNTWISTFWILWYLFLKIFHFEIFRIFRPFAFIPAYFAGFLFSLPAYSSLSEGRVPTLISFTGIAGSAGLYGRRAKRNCHIPPRVNSQTLFLVEKNWSAKVAGITYSCWRNISWVYPLTSRWVFQLVGINLTFFGIYQMFFRVVYNSSASSAKLDFFGIL